METPKVYVICDANCKFEGMTKEQIYTAIVQAVNEGTIGDIDTGFVTTIKDILGNPLKFFVGTQAKYNALSATQRQGLFAIITDDTNKDGITEAINTLNQEIKAIQEAQTYKSKTVTYNTRIFNWSIHNLTNGIYSCLVRGTYNNYSHYTLFLHCHKRENDTGINPIYGTQVKTVEGSTLGLYVDSEGICFVEAFDDEGKKIPTKDLQFYVMDFTKIL